MAEKVLVLSADKWAMTDEKTGENRTGLTVNYVNDYRDSDEKSEGYKPTKISVPAELMEQVFKQFQSAGLPAMCELDFGTRPGKDNKPTVVVNAVKVLQKVALFPKAAA